MDVIQQSIISENRGENSLGVQILTQQLVKHNQLREEERKLRARVEFLEQQAASQGPLKLDVNLAMLLKEEKVQLLKTRQQVELQEAELEKLESLPEDERVRLAADRVEQLVSDTKALRGQIRIHQTNVNFLEEKTAQLGLDTRVDLANELATIRRDLERVQSELADLKNRLQREWGIDPDSIKNLDSMDEQKIRAMALEVVSRRDELERVRKQQQIDAAAKSYDQLVLTALEELRGAVYPGPDYSTNRNFSLDFDNQWRLPSFEVKWMLSFIGTYGGVSVTLNFDHQYRPTGFSCAFVHPDGKVLKTTPADLTRESLVEALMDLHVKKNPWWRFWSQSPAFPESWMTKATTSSNG